MSGLKHPFLLRAAGALNLPIALANPFGSRRAPLHAADFPLLLLFTPKAGCTSLLKWFLFHTGKLEEATRFAPWVHHYRTQVLYRQSGYRWEAFRLVVSRRRPIVKLVRNPYDRAVSSFFHVLGNAHAKSAEGWENSLIAAARQRSGAAAPGLPQLSFRQFVRFVARNGTDRSQTNGHIARQYLYGEDGRIDRIVKLELFGEDIRRLEADYGLEPSPLEIIAKSSHHRTTVRHHKRQLIDATADLEITPEQVRRRQLPPYDTFYDDETRQLVRQCFAIDFDAYGYDE